MNVSGIRFVEMAALAGALFLIFLLAIGSGLVISAAVGLIACKKTDGRNGGKGRWIFIFKILLWILLGAGIVVTVIPLMYIYLIVANW